MLTTQQIALQTFWICIQENEAKVYLNLATSLHHRLLQGEGAGRIRVTLGWMFAAIFFYLVRSGIALAAVDAAQTAGL